MKLSANNLTLALSMGCKKTTLIPKGKSCEKRYEFSEAQLQHLIETAKNIGRMEELERINATKFGEDWTMPEGYSLVKNPNAK